jgi:K+-sensing histidine kinase KdpD
MQDPPPPLLPELLGLMTHDLRNPLAALAANLDFMGSVLGGEQADVMSALDDARAACALLDHLVANLDLLAISLRGSAPPCAALSLVEAVDRAISRRLLEARVLEVELGVTGRACRPEVMVEMVLFGRALDGVLANALQHAPEQSRVRILVEERGGRGCVSVLDDGPVVPAPLRQEVLTAAGQSKAKQIRNGRYGRGCGLYGAARAASLAGASLEIKERDGVSELELSAPLIAER